MEDDMEKERAREEQHIHCLYVEVPSGDRYNEYLLPRTFYVRIWSGGGEWGQKGEGDREGVLVVEGFQDSQRVKELEELVI